MDTKKTAHTPGPWEWGVQLNHKCRIQVHARKKVIAFVPYSEDAEGEPDHRNDARLIAAAPDLLEAAKLAIKASEYLINELQGDGKFHPLEMWAMGAFSVSLADAIAKAEGR